MSSKLRRFVVIGSLLVSAVAASSVVGTSGSPAAATEFRSAQAGTFYAIASYRSFDSRIGLSGKIVPPDESTLAPDVPFPIHVQYESDGDGTRQFPDEAIAVTYNVTITQTESAGYVQIDGFFHAQGQTSTVNWSGPNETDANSGVARLTSAFDAPAALGIFVGGEPGAKAHVIVDITGYYMPAP